MATINTLVRRFRDAVAKEAQERGERITRGDMDADTYKRSCGERTGWLDCHERFMKILDQLEKEDG